MATGKLNSYNRIEIDLGALRSNYRQIQTVVGECVKIMAIVKSDGYGHGLVPVAQALGREGAKIFGVAEVEEGVRLRQAGIVGEIVILLGVQPDSFGEILEYGLQTVVYDYKILEALSAYAERHNRQIGVHLKIDTGMGRLGIMPEQLDGFLEFIKGSSGVKLVGILSHFPQADAVEDKSQALEQNRRFSGILSEVRERHGSVSAHMANSAAIINLAGSRYDMVRPGITLYGCYPFPKELGGKAAPALKPVMTFKSKVIQVKDVPSGCGISYGHVYKTERPTKLAVLPLGYDDGFLRRLTGKAHVLIGGYRVPVVGRICMNACLADITDLGKVKTGDEAVIMGRQGHEEITADEIADWSGTISYEILCLFGGRNQRVFLPD